MTDLEFWIVITIVVNLLINTVASELFRRKRLEQLESYFNGNESFERNRSLRVDSYLGRQMRLHMMFATIFMARRLHKNGFLAKDEEKKIPKKLRVQILSIYAHLSLVMISSLVLCFSLS